MSILNSLLRNRYNACIAGFLLRLGFMVYGELHDRFFRVKYTDIDYEVFTDAARYICEGLTPYHRETYRYSPLLALAMVPNISVHHLFGKCIFSVFDIITGFMMCRILEREKSRQPYATASIFHPVLFVGILWLWNPFVITISTRGSAEAIQSFLVVTTLCFLLENRILMSALFFGFAVHFKIYPIVFSISILAYIVTRDSKRSAKQITGTKGTPLLKMLFSILSVREVWGFFVASAVTFLALTAWMYNWYGFVFIKETYLYHFSRTDVKHNFSPYFYIMHLLSASLVSKVLGFIAFVPQAASVIWIGLKYHHSLPLAWFLQMFAFVSFNKVCTSQYFIWYLSLLPLALGYMNIKWHCGVTILFYWIGAQAMWLFLAYLYEFQGFDVLSLVWIASILFLLVNIWILVQLTRSVVKEEQNTSQKKD